jgi:PhnB protein
MFVQTYLTFNGRCEEALEFYKKAIGAEVQAMMRFGENPDPEMRAHQTPGSENKVMHSCVRIRDTEVMASDGYCTGSDMKFEGFSLTLNAKDVADAEKLFGALSDGGQVTMPLTPTFFAERFGVLSDKFGVNWMIIVGK